MKVFSLEDTIEAIKNSTQESKIYLGSDSERFRRGGLWHATYTVCAVIHKDGNKGCSVFGYSETEQDFDQKKNKPKMRLMNEVIKVAEFYLKLHDAIGTRECEIHLDINPNKKFGSSCAVDEAIGYIKGVCNITPKVKPDSPCASFCADRLVDLLTDKALVEKKIAQKILAA